MAYIRYNIYLWTPPQLTHEEEIEVGRQIVAEGRDAFLKKTPYLSKEEQRRIDNAKNIPPIRKFIAGIIFAALLIFVLIIAWLPFLIVAIPVAIFSGGSMLHARNRYRNWVDEMVAKFAVHAQKQGR